jgi:PadR family transcriptional regulator PadR
MAERRRQGRRRYEVANLLLTIHRGVYIFLLILNRRIRVTAQKAEVLQGTLDLIVLKTLETMGPMHGYGIARRIEQVSRELLSLNQGTLYPALLRLQQRRWISSEWGASENNRKAKYYSLTRAGKKQLAAEAKNWEQIAAVIARFLQPETEETR